MNINVNKEWNEYESHPWNGIGVIARRATLGIALSSISVVYLLSAAAMFWAFESGLLGLPRSRRREELSTSGG